MAELATLARPYAQAVFQLAVDSNSLAAWSARLGFLSAVMQDANMVALVSNPAVNKATLTQILLDLCQQQSDVPFDEEANNFIKLLAANHRLAVMRPLAAQFEMLKAAHEGYLRVELTSAYEVDDAQQQAVEAVLTKRFGRKIEINVKMDKALLGGWVIRAGDQVIDLSMRGRLQQLATELRG